MRKPYTPERAYRWSVLPCGLFMIVGGIVLPSAALLMPSYALFVPPFSDPWLKRAVFAGMSLPLLPLGLGLCFRSKLAWWGFFAWLIIGTAWQVVGGFLDPQFAHLVVVSPVFTLGFAVGTYFATKPVFNATNRKTQSACEAEEGETGSFGSPG
jgi:hypothetical protein